MNCRIRKGNKGSLIYAQMKEMAVNYRFRPGERLQPADLARRLGVSHIPVREALTQLYGETLIMARTNHGFFAKTLTLDEMLGLYELAFLVLKHSIEKNVASFSMMGMSKPMELEWDRDGRLTNATSEFYRSHAMFIEQLYDRVALLSGNPAMVDVVRSFNDRTRFIRLLDLESARNIAEIAEDIFGLIDALVSQDAAAAAANLKRQFDKKRGRLPDLVKEGIARTTLNAFFPGPTTGRSSETLIEPNR